MSKIKEVSQANVKCRITFLSQNLILKTKSVSGHPTPQITWRKQVRHDHDRAKIRLRDKLNRDFFGQLENYLGFFHSHLQAH